MAKPTKAQKRKKTVQRVIAIVAVVLVAGLAGTLYVRQRVQRSVTAQSGSNVKSVTVTTGSIKATVSGSGTASEIANFAMSFIGYSYVWGGKSPSTGFDCSGLMYYVLTQYGYKMNRVANDQMSQGTYVSRSDLQVGDLVFFGYGNYANHVGMYIGGGNFVHASTPSTGVRINSLDESYYKTRFLCGRRII